MVSSVGDVAGPVTGPYLPNSITRTYEKLPRYWSVYIDVMIRRITRKEWKAEVSKNLARSKNNYIGHSSWLLECQNFLQYYHYYN